MKLKIPIALFFLFIVSGLLSQNSRKIDSLLGLIKTQKEDTNKVNTLFQLTRSIRKKDPNKAMEYIREGLMLSEKIGFKKGIIKFNNIRGNVYSVQGKNDSAIISYEIALKDAEVLNDKQVLSTINNNIGLIYFNRGDYTKALEYYMKALKLSESGNDNYNILQSLNNIAGVYYSQKNVTKTLEYTKKVLEQAGKTGEKVMHARALSNIASTYEQMRDYKAAVDYNLKAIDEFEAIQEKGIAYIYGNVANLYVLMNDDVQAEKFANKALTISLEEHDKMVESLSYSALARINKQKNNLGKAEEFAKKANQISREIESKEFLKQDYQLLSEIYENKRDYKTALEYHKLFSGIQDSLYNEENLKQVTQMQQLFETEKKEKEITLLTKEKQLQEAELERKIEQLNKNRIVTYSIAGGSVLVLLLLIVVYRGYNEKQKANKLLEEQKKEIIIQRDEIGLKNKEITDSISYARRIQDALLPSPEKLDTMFSESFVLYLPKDIVSGDFFWIAEKNAKKFIAVADCTGHGVPGGFMSILGMEELSKAAKFSDDPAEMLKHLNNSIKKALQQNNNESNARDGMDIVLCSIDEQTGIIKYAGANRPLWILDQNKLTEVSPDKAAIGGHTSDQYDFRSNELKMQKGNMLYLFSDGFADQFGGEKKKKLMTKRFKELILHVSAFPVEEQKSRLRDYFNSWRGELEQIDDVIVIGIKV